MTTIFVPGKLVNVLNGSHGHWSRRARWAKQWRERAYLTMLTTPKFMQAVSAGDAATPKRITFTAHTHNRVDSDGLAAMLKPSRDALKDAGIIHDDGPDSGHVFEYAQVIDRAHRGVAITWAAR